ncbi:unnamed protein product [Camellia sinensis]
MAFRIAVLQCSDLKVQTLDLTSAFMVAAQGQGSTFVQMGCISSKILSKSMSFRKEMRQSLQRTTDGILGLEEIFTTGPKPTLHYPSNKHETINTWELIAGLEEEQEVQHANHLLLPCPGVEKLDIYEANRSQSCHWSPENEMSPRVPRDDEFTEEEFKWGSKGVARARSFHTVEEYDAMIENIQLVRKQVEEFGDYKHDSATEMQHSKCSSKKSQRVDDYYCSNIHESTQSSEESIRENSMTDKTRNPLTSGPGTKQVLPSLNSSTLIEKSKTFEEVAHEGNISEKGLKRKAIAQSLKSLQTPSTIDFPNVASLREWLQMGEKCTPLELVTPKFGSYNVPMAGSDKECREDSIFDPELVAAFEECMIQLAVEEEMVLKQIEQVLEEEHTNDTEAEEESSSNTHLDLHLG